jgi:hypothetical protein
VLALVWRVFSHFILIVGERFDFVVYSVFSTDLVGTSRTPSLRSTDFLSLADCFLRTVLSIVAFLLAHEARLVADVQLVHGVLLQDLFQLSLRDLFFLTEG